MNNNISPTGNGTPTKKRRKFNIIDFFILLLVLAIVIATVYAFSPWSQIKKLWTPNETSLQYVVEMRNVDAQYVQLIKNGDSVVNSVTKNSLGNVTSVDNTEKSYELRYKIDDESQTVHGVLVEIPDKYDVKIYITAVAQYEPNIGYTVNGCRVAVGEQLDLRFPQFTGSAYCIAISAS